MRKKDKRIKRRDALKWIAASGAAAFLGRSPLVSPVFARDQDIDQTVRIGALIPLTGDADAYAQQMRLGIDTAVAEINGSGGVLGRKIAVEYRDSETTPAVLPERCRELIDEWGAIALIGPWAAAGRKYAARFLSERNIPLVNASNHAGGFCSPVLFSLGPTTSQDGHALVRYLGEEEQIKDYFMLGSYPSWQNTMFRQLRLPMYQRGHHVHGQALTATGEQQFRPIVRWIQETNTASVLFCVMRKYGQEFLHQASELGLLNKLTVGWIGFNDTLVDGLTSEELERIVTTSPFVASDPEGGVPDFVARVRSQHGSNAPIGYHALTHYNAVQALKTAWEKSGEVSAEAALTGLRGLSFESPAGPVAIDAANQHATMPIVVARGSRNGLQVVKRLGPIDPDPGCSI